MAKKMARSAAARKSVPTKKPQPSTAMDKDDVPKSSLATPLTQRDLWKAAIKPPMYTVAITPITVGSLAAYADTQRFHLATCLLFLSAAIFIIAWLNLTNDVFDFDAGIDVHKRESVVNLCGATRVVRNLVLLVANMFLLLGFLALFALSYFPFGLDFTVMSIMSLAIFGGYAYQGPPFRLGYYGLGEPICFVTWFLTVCAAYYSQRAAHADVHAHYMETMPAVSDRLGHLFSDMLMSRNSCLPAAALLVAYATALILFCSHFHQEEDDRKAGKLSPIVRLGTAGAVRVLTLVSIGFVAIHIGLFQMGLLPWPVLALSTLATRHVYQLERFVSQNHKVPSVVRAAKYYAVKLHFVHGMWISVGYFITGKNGILRSS